MGEGWKLDTENDEFDDRLHKASHRGDLTLVTYYVEVEKLPVDAIDERDGTPLYYAAHGGHEHVYRYLLQSGARCDANTHQGERVFYAALNDPLRSLLRSYAVTAAALHPFRQHMFHLLSAAGGVRGVGGCDDASEGGGGGDVTFVVNGEEIVAHRFVLAARCEYIRERFEETSLNFEEEEAGLSSKSSEGHRGRWAGLERITIDHGAVTAEAFRCLLLWLYAGRVEIPSAHVEAFRILCQRCRLNDVLSLMSNAEATRREGGRGKDSCGIGQLILDAGNEVVLESYTRLARSILRGDGNVGVNVRIRVPIGSTKVLSASSENGNDETTLGCNRGGVVGNGETVTIGMHRAVLTTQSPYFTALLSGYKEDDMVVSGSMVKGPSGCLMFREAATAVNGGVIELHDMPADVFRVVVIFLYSGRLALFDEEESDDFDEINDADKTRPPSARTRNAEESVYDPRVICAVLEAAEVLLLPRLKALCGSTLAEYITRILSPFRGSVAAEDAGGEWGDDQSTSLRDDSAELFVLLDGLDIALRFELDRLETHCYDAIARHLDCFLGHLESCGGHGATSVTCGGGSGNAASVKCRFEEMIVESAWSVTDRQMEDSIPIVDGVRGALEDIYHQSSDAWSDDESDEEEERKVEGSSDSCVGGGGEYRRKNRLIDDCLAMLGLATATGTARGANTGLLATRVRRTSDGEKREIGPEPTC